VDQTEAQGHIDSIMDAAKIALHDLVGTSAGFNRVVRDAPVKNLADALHAAISWAISVEFDPDYDESFALDKWM
jgi:hypothetical protein